MSLGNNLVLHTRDHETPWGRYDSGTNNRLFFHRTHVAFKEHAVYTVSITFLEVKMEDYGYPFTCHAGVSAVYFMLKPPGNIPIGKVLLRGLKWWKGHTRKTSGMKCRREAVG